MCGEGTQEEIHNRPACSAATVSWMGTYFSEMPSGVRDNCGFALARISGRQISAALAERYCQVLSSAPAAA